MTLSWLLKADCLPLGVEVGVTLTTRAIRSATVNTVRRQKGSPTVTGRTVFDSATFATCCIVFVHLLDGTLDDWASFDLSIESAVKQLEVAGYGLRVCVHGSRILNPRPKQCTVKFPNYR